jgi:hypothetical protein
VSRRFAAMPVPPDAGFLAATEFIDRASASL